MSPLSSTSSTEPLPVDRGPARVSRLADQGQENDLAHTTPAERMAMVWQLTKDAWAFMGQPVDESEFRRDISRVIRGGEYGSSVDTP